MKRYALILALVVALAAGFGCAKKKAAEPGYADNSDSVSPEMQAAIQQITDGRVLFAFDKFSIKPEYKDVLKTKADLMKKYNTFWSKFSTKKEKLEVGGIKILEYLPNREQPC